MKKEMENTNNVVDVDISNLVASSEIAVISYKELWE